jgi:hypothetical protein
MNTPLVIFLVLLACAAGLGCYRYYRSRPAPEEAYFHFQCPICKRKLRYRASKAGQPGMCPRCRNACTFPLAPGK